MGGGEQSTSNPGHRPRPLPDSQTPLRLEPSEPYPAEGHVLLSPLPGRAVSFPDTQCWKGAEGGTEHPQESAPHRRSSLPAFGHTQPPSGIGACPWAALMCSAPPSSRTGPCSHPHSVPRWQSQARPFWSSLKVQGRQGVGRPSKRKCCFSSSPPPLLPPLHLLGHSLGLGLSHPSPGQQLFLIKEGFLMGLLLHVLLRFFYGSLMVPVTLPFNSPLWLPSISVYQLTL